MSQKDILQVCFFVLILQQLIIVSLLLLGTLLATALERSFLFYLLNNKHRT